MMCYEHYGHSRNLTNSPLQVSVACGYNVTLVLLYSVDKAVVSIDSLVHAWKTLKSRILGHPKSHSVFSSKLFYLSHYTVSDARGTFCIEAVHHGLENIKLVTDGEVDKVGVNQNKEWRTKLSVVLKE